MSSMTMRSLRQIRVTVRATDPSALAFPIVAVSVSRVCQATRRSLSIAAWARASTRCDFPVPDGPAMTRFSALPIHSRVIRAFWVASEMEDSSGRQEENVFPEGKAAVLLSPGWRPPVFQAGGRVLSRRGRG